jgi:hypothetical protein
LGTQENVPSSSKKSRPSRGSYSTFEAGEHKAAKAVVLQHMAQGASASAAIAAAATSYPLIAIKRQTANSWHKKMNEDALASANGDVASADTSLAAFDRHATAKDGRGNTALTSEEDRQFLQSIIKSRDDRNAGIPRKELICIICELGSTTFKAAENHLDYLIRSKKLPLVSKLHSY